MNNFNSAFALTVSSVAITILVSMTVMAKSMSDDQYNFLKNNIEVEYTSAMVRCNSIAVVKKSLCLSEAQSTRNASKVDLDNYIKLHTETPMPQARNNGKQNNLKSMPVIEDLSSTFKKSRLI